jgi:hypothetical protein
MELHTIEHSGLKVDLRLQNSKLFVRITLSDGKTYSADNAELKYCFPSPSITGERAFHTIKKEFLLVSMCDAHGSAIHYPNTAPEDLCGVFGIGGAWTVICRPEVDQPQSTGDLTPAKESNCIIA